MKNRIMACVTAFAACILTLCCLASCNGSDGKTSTDHKDDKAPSDIISDAADEIIPDKERGMQTDDKADEFTADEKDSNRPMMPFYREGK
ncbi:MAG: hypothetical protein E7667_06140 [Ruminococcaceae bacterium]|nr:hypothetical protein [Oscillospiraceae bacterium]